MTRGLVPVWVASDAVGLACAIWAVVADPPPWVGPVYVAAFVVFVAATFAGLIQMRQESCCWSGGWTPTVRLRRKTHKHSDNTPVTDTSAARQEIQ